MDGQIGIRYKVDLERMLLDGSAEPTYLWLSLLEDITDCFSDDQQIGSGGFAVVYKGIVGERMVAVKKLSQTLDMHENKFHKEVECLMKAKHKNIVRFLGYCSDTQGRIANYEGKFVMADLRNWLLCFEYVPNGSLDKYITDSSGGLEWGERYQIIKGICEGLLHLHEKHILHLDLKPANILIDDRMVPKIADFGLSRCLDKDQTRAFTSHLCGSQGYLAPEFYRGQVAFFSDIYSLGVIIMEILTGEKGYPEDEYLVRQSRGF
ncbi:cysteine-rich receptor-like protein kinase 19 isoform X3 [Aegilops tauschii subsp. strangulata]|uniref:cysteine-rich receptor-like protein kinase 19 isoform X3 n=1 Tax=Aegilops tauschii subsp. strangulata TaxID=200361 RepID=UPI001ABD4286